MEESGNDKDAGPQLHKAKPRDGLIDFKSYSIDQLLELEGSIDPEAFPENHRNLLAALEAKREGRRPQATPEVVPGRFTRRAGLLGWINAKLARSPLYGSGSLHANANEITLSGWQRTWLGVPLETQLTYAAEQIRNVAEVEGGVRFEIARERRLAQRVVFKPQHTEQVDGLTEKLPKAQSSGFAERWGALRAFNLRMQSVARPTLVTPILVALNVAVFAAMCVAAKSLSQFSLQLVLAWGANYGPWTIHGQWWRLLTAIFLHANLAHILLNMWALWNIGRLTERLFGRPALLFIYLASGFLASLTSIAWNPAVTTVGASGAIFGLFGAFLAFLFRQRQEIPLSIVRRLWLSTAVFVVFSLIDGATNSGIDNAAHVGGLLSGIVLGLMLARPLSREVRVSFPVAASFSATAFLIGATLLAYLQVNGVGSNLTIPEEYFRKHTAYAKGEAENSQLWTWLEQRVKAGTISNAELSQRFEQDILPFWQKQKDQLNVESEHLKGPEGQYSRLMADFAASRYALAQAVIVAAKNGESAPSSDVVGLVKNMTVIKARLDRVWMRSEMDHRPRALSNAPLIGRLRRMMTGKSWNCILAPPQFHLPVSDQDDHADGPAMRQAAGCRAQQLFMSGDYESLELMMTQALMHLDDLPDGSSSYEGIVTGLNELFDFGGLATEIVFGHTADWRRSLGTSTMADLIEALAFNDWAWSARGHGYANDVSSQNMAIYAYRTEMAAAALEEVADRAKSNPLWYALSLDVGLDQSQDREKLRAIFDRGEAQVPEDRTLYRRMLRILMPRWGGSYEEVDKFIEQMYAKSVKTRGFERYAELYSVYAHMEGDELDFFADTRAFWSGMRTGYLSLLKRHPKSDAVLNNFAYMACRADDKVTYNQLRRVIGKKLSSTAWSEKYSITSCDKKLASAVEFSEAATLDMAPDGKVRSLGGLRIGMTREELLSAKGNPVRREDAYWVYNTVDSTHNGVLTVVFSPATPEAESVVQAIAYSGDEISSPLEVPYLDGMTATEVFLKYGQPIKGHLSLYGDVTFKFSNGVYINTLDQQVYRYGIAAVR